MIIHLHIGTPKSGTSYLQDLLGRNRDRLADVGVLWPTWDVQISAVRDLVGLYPRDAQNPAVAGAWDRLCGELLAWDGHAAVLSMEWLVHALPQHVERVVRDLAPHEVRVVVTARDLARCVPAQWQEQVQNGAVWTWEEYLDAVTADQAWEHAAGRQFWTDHDLGLMLRSWSSAVPVERTTVVTVPHRGSHPEVLWQRFAGALGLDPAAYDTEVPPRNASLGVASAEVVRRVNVLTREQGLDWAYGDPVVKRILSKRTLGRREHGEGAPRLPPARREWADRESRRLIADVRASGVGVAGSLDDLLPEDSSVADVPAPSAEVMLDAALDGLTGLVMELARRVEIDMAPPPPPPPPTRLQRVYRSRPLTPVRAVLEPLRGRSAAEDGQG